MSVMPPGQSLIGQVETQLAQSVPLLPEDELVPFVHRFFERGKEFLGLVNDYPSPLYVYEPEVLRERAHRFRKAFAVRLPETSFYFAVKSNNYPEVARTAIESGFGLDVSSGLELETALLLDAADIIFSGPGKTENELTLALAHRQRVTVLLDSFSEMHRLDAIASAKSQKIRVGVRLSTTNDGLWRKFGILPEELALFCTAIRSCQGLEFMGLQFHTSWNLTPAAQVDFIERLGRILNSLPQPDLSKIRFIDIGGGYWPEQGEWLQPEATAPGQLKKQLGINRQNDKSHYRLPAQTIDSFASVLSEAIHDHLLSIQHLRICFEPGRWICNDAMHLLLTVLDLKNGNIAITDAGTNAVGWERFEHDYFPVLNLSRPALRERPCTILGSLCTPHDLWGFSYWGENIQPGDVLLIPTQGAYTYSLRQNFIKPLPGVAHLTTQHSTDE